MSDIVDPELISFAQVFAELVFNQLQRPIAGTKIWHSELKLIERGKFRGVDVYGTIYSIPANEEPFLQKRICISSGTSIDFNPADVITEIRNIPNIFYYFGPFVKNDRSEIWYHDQMADFSYSPLEKCANEQAEELKDTISNIKGKLEQF